MRFTEIAIAKPFEGKPKINIAECIGASPRKPILTKIPVMGERPIKYEANNLPKGLTLENGIIKGTVEKEGNYEVTVVCENKLGRDEKKIVFEIKENALQLTPLMGFTSWNAFAFQVTQEDMERTAQKISETGISEYGYNFINTDSGWQGEYGGKFDAVMPNEKFPDMKGMCDRLHEMGFKCGIYSTPMINAFGCAMDYKPLPPGCTQGEPDVRFADERGGIGVIRKEQNNALQWEEWGFDYLKYDWRPCDPYNAELMRKELAALSRDFVYCVSVRARAEYHTYWEKYCNSYRCNPDSLGTWDNLLEIYRTYFEFIDYINKGHYFDLDMLETGRCGLFEFFGFYNDPAYGFSEDEQLVAYSMRAFLSSPIQLSCKLDDISEFEMSMYCNEEVIAINQDCGFNTAKPCQIIEDGKKIIHVFRKKLKNGDVAYSIFNLGETGENVIVYLDDTSFVRDVWAKKDLGLNNKISVSMQPHTVRMFRVSEA